MNKLVKKSRLRPQIIHSIDTLIHEVNEKRRGKAVECLSSLKYNFMRTEKIFSLDSLVFGGFVQAALSPDILADKYTLTQLRDELLGVVPYWNTYAIKHNFVDSLQGDTLQAYMLVKKLNLLLSAKSKGNGCDTVEEQEELREDLHELCHEKINVHTIPELLVTNSSQVLLALPYEYPETFDLMDDSSSFSSIYPTSSPQTLKEHLDYLAALLQKIEGDRTLFIDIHILPTGFILNLR